MADILQLQTSTGLDKDLAPNRRQAIIWANADPIYWRINEAQGGDELKRHALSNLYMAVHTIWYCIQRINVKGKPSTRLQAHKSELFEET